MPEVECQHEKVYSPFVLTSYPEQRHWICRRCLAEGVDMDPLPSQETYAELRRRKEATNATAQES